MGTGGLSGGSINPARSLGPAIASGVWTSNWVFFVGPCVGSVLSAVIYTVVFAKRATSPSSRRRPASEHQPLRSGADWQ
eukprot:JP442240.1.p2 GENE.JP442240.1~~JP442240.1.p2  ORF type:complete len:92 (+),score=7.30 JP442240.1:41-277(+)